MKTSHKEYIITGGQEGKSRLNILSEVLHPYTRSLLETQGLTTGSSFFDVGCGGGNVALMAAQIAGKAAKVAAIDFDEEIISLVRQDAINAGIGNISFRAMSAYEIDYHNEFDISYARFLLTHLTDPLTVLQKMVQSVKPGGKIIVEDIHFSGHFCYPACGAFDSYVSYYTTAARHNHQNAEIGPSLFSLFHQAGIGNIGFDVIQPCFSNGPGKWMAYITLDRINDTLVAQGIATTETITGMLHELEDFTNDEQTIISLPRIFRVWGQKKTE